MKTWTLRLISLGTYINMRGPVLTKAALAITQWFYSLSLRHIKIPENVCDILSLATIFYFEIIYGHRSAVYYLQEAAWVSLHSLVQHWSPHSSPCPQSHSSLGSLTWLPQRVTALLSKMKTNQILGLIFTTATILNSNLLRKKWITRNMIHVLLATTQK